MESCLTLYFQKIYLSGLIVEIKSSYFICLVISTVIIVFIRFNHHSLVLLVLIIIIEVVIINELRDELRGFPEISQDLAVVECCSATNFDIRMIRCFHLFRLTYFYQVLYSRISILSSHQILTFVNTSS